MGDLTPQYAIEHIDLSRLAVAEENCRKEVEQPDESSAVRDLADNIREHGLLHPLQVRKIENGYAILAGQRRFLAARSLGWKSVPCRVLDVTPQEAEEVSLVENLQRAHLSHADKVRAFAKLDAHYGGDIVKICKAVSLSPATVRNYISAGKLPDTVLARLDADKKERRLTLTSAGRLGALRDDERLEALAEALPRVGTNDAQKAAIDRAVKNRALSVEQILTAQAAEKARKPANPPLIAMAPVSGPRAPEVGKDVQPAPQAADSPWIWDEKGRRLVVPQPLYAGVLRFVRESGTTPPALCLQPSTQGPGAKKRAGVARPRI
jgi:ParB family transcriptional regulator, chromosome partitioning protein